MPSNRRRLASLVAAAGSLALAVTLAGCSLRLGDGKEPSSTLRLGRSGTACLSGSGAVFASFLSGEGTGGAAASPRGDARLASLWDCAGSSLRLFRDRTRGSRPGGAYDPRELRKFLQTYFLADAPISDAFLEEAMVLKQHLLGGGAETLAPGELDRLQDLLDLLKRHTLALRPFMPLTPAHAREMDPETLERAIAALEVAAADLGGMLKATGMPYSLARLDRLLTELQAFTGERSGGGMLRLIRDHMPLLGRLKALLVSPDETRIAGSDWQELLGTAAHGYGISLRTARLLAPGTELSRGGDRRALRGAVLETRRLLERAVARRADGTLPFAELERTLDGLVPGDGPFEWEGLPLPRGHVRTLLRVIVRKGLGGSEKGITAGAVARAWELFEDWNEGQRYLEGAFALAPRDGDSVAGEPAAATGDRAVAPEPRTRAQLRRVGVEEALARGDRLPGPSSAEAAGRRAAERIRGLLERTRPMLAGDSSRVDFGAMSRDADAQRFSWSAAVALNWTDVLARWLVSAYGGAGVDRITYPQLDAFYLDLRDVGIDLQLIDPLHTDTARKRFGEANLFTFGADGDGYVHGERAPGTLSVDEARDLLAVLISGRGTSRAIHRDLVGRCPTGPRDMFDVVTVDSACFREGVFTNLAEYWAQFPGLVDWFRRAPEAEKTRFACRFESLVRREGFSEARIDGSDLEGFGILPHYVETLFARFDRDGDGFLDEREAFGGPDPIYPVFRAVMREAVEQSTGSAPGERRVQTVVAFYLANGRKPTTPEYLRWYLRHFNWLARKALGDWEFRADRGRVLAIMSEIARGATAGPDAGEARCEDWWARELARDPKLRERFADPR